MGDTRRIRPFVGALVVVAASALVAVASGSPAAAAPVPCTQTFTSTQSNQQAMSVRVPSDGTWLTPGARVTDVDVRILGQAYGDSTGPMTITVLHDRVGDIYRNRYQDPGTYQSWDLTFDDEAGAPPAPGQTTGRVRPTTPLAIHDSGLASGTWRVQFEQNLGGFEPSVVVLTITSDDCDSDGDGVPETIDNCPSVANSDQTDWDADRVGNVCDATPGTAPAPPTTTPTTPPTTGTPSSTCSAGCAYERTVGLRHRAKRHRLTGTVGSSGGRLPYRRRRHHLAQAQGRGPQAGRGHHPVDREVPHEGAAQAGAVLRHGRVTRPAALRQRHLPGGQDQATLMPAA